MTRQICKEIVDHPFKGIHAGVEAAIKQTAELVAAEKLEGVDAECVQGWRQRLANCEIAMVHGTEMPKGGLLGIVQSMDKKGLVDKDAWKMLPTPIS